MLRKPLWQIACIHLKSYFSKYKLVDSGEYASAFNWLFNSLSATLRYVFFYCTLMEFRLSLVVPDLLSFSWRKSNTDVLEPLHRLECEPYFRDRKPSYALFYSIWSHFTFSFIVCSTSMYWLYISAFVRSAYFIFIILCLFILFWPSAKVSCVFPCVSLKMNFKKTVTWSYKHV